MQRLNLAKNKLTQIPQSALSGLAYLETLELSDNPINQINEGDFNGNFLIPQVYLVLFSLLSKTSCKNTLSLNEVKRTPKLYYCPFLTRA